MGKLESHIAPDRLDHLLTRLSIKDKLFSGPTFIVPYAWQGWCSHSFLRI